jgi:hypothetical protein
LPINESLGGRDLPGLLRFSPHAGLSGARDLALNWRGERGTAFALSTAGGARKPELRRTAWWSRQDSNQHSNDYGRWMTHCVECAASVREPQHLLLTRPCDRCIEEAGDTDSARKPTIDSRFDEAWREESQ